MSSDCILPFNDYYNHYLHIEDKKEKKTSQQILSSKYMLEYFLQVLSKIQP